MRAEDIARLATTLWHVSGGGTSWEALEIFRQKVLIHEIEVNGPCECPTCNIADLIEVLYGLST